MKRTSFLARGVLRRYTPLRSVSSKRRRENDVRRALLSHRVDAGCEAGLPGCSGRVTDAHEIRTRARGGSITNLGNIAFLCRSDDDWITTHPDWSDRHGWTVPSWSTEADEVIAWHARLAGCTDPACPTDHREGR